MGKVWVWVCVTVAGKVWVWVCVAGMGNVWVGGVGWARDGWVSWCGKGVGVRGGCARKVEGGVEGGAAGAVMEGVRGHGDGARTRVWLDWAFAGSGTNVALYFCCACGCVSVVGTRRTF